MSKPELVAYAAFGIAVLWGGYIVWGLVGSFLDTLITLGG